MLQPPSSLLLTIFRPPFSPFFSEITIFYRSFFSIPNRQSHFISRAEFIKSSLLILSFALAIAHNIPVNRLDRSFAITVIPKKFPHWALALLGNPNMQSEKRHLIHMRAWKNAIQECKSTCFGQQFIPPTSQLLLNLRQNRIPEFLPTVLGPPKGDPGK